MRRPKQFNKRTLHFDTVQEENIKYILVYEGSKTEVQYFNGVREKSNKIGINPIIELLPLLRSIPEETVSHPNKIIKLLDEHLNSYYTAKVVIDKILDFFEQDLTATYANVLKERLSNYFSKELGIEMYDTIDINEDLLNKVVTYLNEDYTCLINK